MATRDPGARLAELRAAFAASFASPVQPPGEPAERLVGLRVGETALAVRLSELDGIEPAGAIVALPDSPAELLGITSLRSAILPVYSLAALAGWNDAAQPRWLLLAGGGERVGLAFARLDGQLEAPCAAGPGELVRSGGLARVIVSIASLLKAVDALIGRPALHEVPIPVNVNGDDARIGAARKTTS